jgi:hypothetical protein
MKYDRSDRARRKAISDVTVCEFMYVPRLTLLRFDSHSATRYPPVDAPTVARPFSTIPPTSENFSLFLYLRPVRSGFRRRDPNIIPNKHSVFRKYFQIIFHYVVAKVYFRKNINKIK